MLAKLVLTVLLAGGGAQEWRGEAAEKQAVVLDTPFHFLLHLDGYRVERLAQESDIFSSWGMLMLGRRGHWKPSAMDDVRRRLLRAAGKAGWKKANEATVDIDDDQRAAWGLKAEASSLNLGQSLKPDKGTSVTRYALRIWIGNDITVAFRVDGN